jgi:hypothetical protein
MTTRNARTLRMGDALDARVKQYAKERGININAAIIVLLERALDATREQQ